MNTENTSSATARVWCPDPQSAAQATATTTTLVSGRPTGPPYFAFGEAKHHQTKITASPATGPTAQPQACAAPNQTAATSSSSSRKTRPRTVQPRAGGTSVPSLAQQVRSVLQQL